MKNDVKNKRCIISGVDISELSFCYNEDSYECQDVKTALLNEVVKFHRAGVEEFYTDCSYGFPLWGGEIVTGLMKYNDIRLYVIFPHEEKPYKYASNWQDRFYKVHELCTDVIPMYVLFSGESQEVLEKKAADYMLADCKRLLFCGNPNGSYLYEEACKDNYDITILKL